MSDDTANLQAQATQADTIAVNGGTQSPEQSAAQPPQPFKAYSTQEDFDNHSKLLKAAAERELLKSLGLKPEEKDKLEAMKKAYDANLSAEERTAGTVKTLEAENGTLRTQLEEKEAVIAAMIKLTGKSPSEVAMVVKMAKGLKDDSTSIEDALDMVMKMLNMNAQAQDEAKPQAQLPKGTLLLQPDQQPTTDINPFKAGEHFNLTEQGRLFRTDPEKARRMAKEAGVPIE